MAINNPEKVVLAENSDHNFPDGTKQPCFLLCPCVYLGLLLVSWLLKCLSALNTGPDRGKSKNKLAFGRAITFLEEGRTLPFAYYFGLTSASLHLPREQMKTGRPPSVLLPKEATEAFSPGTRKGNLFAFQVSSPPIEMKGKLK